MLNSRAEFEAAVPTSLAIEDFTGVAAGTILGDIDVPLLVGDNSGITVSAKGVDLQYFGQFAFGSVGIDNPDVQGNFLSGRAEADLGDETIIKFPHIPNRHHAVGFDFSGAAGGLPDPDDSKFTYRVTTANGTQIENIFTQDDGFVGFFDPICPIVSIEFFDSNPNGINFGEGWALDNLTVSLQALPDGDGDGMPDLYEDEIPGLDSGVADGSGNLDGDTLINVEEFERCTDPNVADSDGDGFLDHEESNSGIFVSPTDPGANPALADSDGDGYSDDVENNTGNFVDLEHTGTDPNDADTDDDGVDDLSDPDPHTPRQPQLVHFYEFDGGLSDTLGGTALTANGGDVDVNVYNFGPNQGLSLELSLTPENVELTSHYSIGLRFVIPSNVAGVKKIVDFKNLLSDEGVYSLDNSLGFVGLGGTADPVLFPDSVIELVLVRDAGSGLCTCYLNGSMAPNFEFNDPFKFSIAQFFGDVADFHFFMDDSAAQNDFSSAYSGTVEEIRIWDGPLSPEDIPSAFEFVPEPEPIRITGVSVDLGAGNEAAVALSWNSRSGQTYSVDSSTDLRIWQELSDNVPSGGDETRYEDVVPGASNPGFRYYQVREN